MVPADLIKFERDGTDDKFWVVHGAHRMEAMKKLDVMNKKKEVSGFPKDRTILCYILKVNAPSLTNYINIKCNDLASNFQSRASNEALFFVYKGLLESTKDPKESMEIIEKICYSRHLGANELTVYRKVAEWPVSVLGQLISVLDMFQTYQTRDATARGVRAKLKRREANNLTTAMFRQLGSCSAEFFKDNYERVLSNEMSLKELLVESDHANRTAIDEKKVVSCAGGVDDIDSLKLKFPDKFNPEVIKQFSGAEISGRKRNVQGQRLKNYMKSVEHGVSFKDPIHIETYQHLTDITSAKLESYDVVVLNVCKNNFEFIKCWIDILCSSLKDFYSVFLMLESERDLSEVYRCLDSWKDKTDFQIHQCMFKKEKCVPNSENISENVVFAVLFGKVTIFKGQIFSLNDIISKDLMNLVSQVTPPAGRVAYVSRGDRKVVQIHQPNRVTENTEVQYTYFVTDNELAKVQEKFFLQPPTPNPNPNPNQTTKTKEKLTEVSESSNLVDEEDEEDEEDDTDYSDESDSDNTDGDKVEECSDNFGRSTCVLNKQSSTSSTKYC